MSKILVDGDLLAQFVKIGSQINDPDPMVLAKFSNHSSTWYVFSCDPVTDTLNTYYTWAGTGWLATLSLRDVIQANGERDTSFTPCRLSDIKSGKVK